MNNITSMHLLYFYLLGHLILKRDKLSQLNIGLDKEGLGNSICLLSVFLQFPDTMV